MTRYILRYAGVVLSLAHCASAADFATEPPALGAGLSPALGAGLPTPPKASTEGLPRDPGDLRSILWCGQETAPQRGETAPQRGENPPQRRVQWTDPATGLAVSQQRIWIPQLGCVSLATTIENRSRTAVRASAIDLVDWSFRIALDSDALRYPELSHRNETWYGSTFWSGPDWTRVGKDWHHPGENTSSIRRFNVPRDGRLTIGGRVYKAHVDKATDGVRLAIRHGPREVWQAEINGDDAQGVEPRLTLDVHKGDAIRFIVHKRGTIYCDTTHWDPVVTYADGQAFQASQGFLTKKQPGSPWSYEVEVHGPTKLSFAGVYGFRSDGSLLEATPAVDRPAVLSHAESLPLVVVADGRDRSGVALAIERGTPWRFRTALEAEGRLHLQLSVGDEKAGWTLKPDETLRLPEVIATAYSGPWLKGLSSLQRLALGAGEALGAGLPTPPKPGALGAGLPTPPEALTEGLRRVLGDLRSAPWCGQETAPQRAETAPQHRVELDYWAMVQLDWRRQDGPLETVEAYASATGRHLQKARDLLADLRQNQPTAFLAAEAQGLESLTQETGRKDLSVAQRRALYIRVRTLKRQIALANPLMQFGKLLFCKRVPTSYSHLVMQYFGWRARPGGGLFILEEPGRSLACRDILQGKLADGNVLQPQLSWDAKRIVFSFVKTLPEQPNPALLDNRSDVGFYHIYEINADGTGLRQLTAGPYDDLMPTYLPDGGIAFSSTRRRGYARCFGAQFSPRWHVYTLHRMDGDGKNSRTISFHDTNEWFPTVSHDGLILYSRWDYIDRDAVTHQNLWVTRPDGSNPQALWGNSTPSPHCTFQMQPIPGSGKIVFTAAAHHSIAAGSIAIVDPLVARDGHSAITRITPEIPFPEAESGNIPEYYEAPWPLSEKYFLVGYSPVPLVWEPGANAPNAVGIYLLDKWGNRELIYRDPEIGSTNPCPLVPRPMPPVLPSSLPHKAPPTGEMVLADVYQGLGNIPRGSIQELRIVQIFPKTTVVANSPPIGMAAEENGRAILGTVPVFPDGSARFTVPAQRPILFQALDADGMAYQTMRSVTYVQPGERVACVGCHEPRMSAPIRAATAAAAMGRGPSPIDPGPLGGRPFSFVEMVQPVLDKHCVRCHGGEKTEGKIDLTRVPSGSFTRSYVALCGDRNFWHEGTNPTNAGEALVPRFGARNQIQVSPPGGMYGARGSRLIKLLHKGHYEVKLAPDDLRCLAAWIDLNAIFYGVNNPEDQARQFRGEPIAMPEVQ